MSEFITIQVGQCGNQIGSILWPLILQEYNIPFTKSTQNRTSSGLSELQQSLTSFFNVPSKSQTPFTNVSEILSSKSKARAVLIDMEDSVISRFKNGALRDLFDRNCFVTNYPGSGNNWAEGFCEHGPKFKEKILKALQNTVERCDSLHGFVLLLSTGGGTGSGLGTYVLKLLADYYPEIERFVCSVYPTGTEDVITCPYNMSFATQQMSENATCVFPCENRALLEILSRQKRNNGYSNGTSMFSPFEDMNSIIVNMILNLTSGSRFPGSLNFDMNEINTNMVPFPKMNFVSSGFNHTNVNLLTKTLKSTSKQAKDELFVASLSRNNQLLKVDPLSSQHVLLASTMIGRGEFTLSDLRSYTEKLQSKARCTPFSRKCTKMGLCNVPSYNNNSTLYSLFNTSAVVDFLNNIRGQFLKLYRKKAHIHHYTKIQGFDVDFFEECHHSISSVIDSYKEMEDLIPSNIARLTPLENL